MSPLEFEMASQDVNQSEIAKIEKNWESIRKKIVERCFESSYGKIRVVTGATVDYRLTDTDNTEAKIYAAKKFLAEMSECGWLYTLSMEYSDPLFYLYKDSFWKRMYVSIHRFFIKV